MSRYQLLSPCLSCSHKSSFHIFDKSLTLWPRSIWLVPAMYSSVIGKALAQAEESVEIESAVVVVEDVPVVTANDCDLLHGGAPDEVRGKQAGVKGLLGGRENWSGGGGGFGWLVTQWGVWEPVLISLETVVVTKGPGVASGEVQGCVREGVEYDGSLEANWQEVPGKNEMGVPGLGVLLGEVLGL